MNIASVLSSHSLRDINPAPQMLPEAAQDHKEPSFAAMLDRSVGDVNKLLNESDKKQTEVAVGKSENLHDAMISFEKADTALKLLVQVRNKAIDAYHEIMRMQV
jgi:flagellar hook-basal body complex protein FliE